MRPRHGDFTDEELAPIEGDRLRPAASGTLVGLLAGAAALGLVHYVARAAVLRAVASAVAAYGAEVSPRASLAIAYGAAAAGGALAGAIFASVTRYLRSWVALVIWALVFFESVAIVVIAASPARFAGVAGPILGAAAVYAFLASLALPLRRR